ncbi:MAG: HD-GYP domain-containing protein [Rhodoferax sp.]
MSSTDIDTQHFTRAVTELGERRPVVTTQAIFNERGVKVLEKGVSVNAQLYERLVAHQLSVPLEQSVHSAPVVNGASLREYAQQLLQEIPFFARMDESLRQGVLLAVLDQVNLPTPVAFQLLLAKEVRPQLFRHSVLMALFAVWISAAPMVSRYDLGVAAMAGLLHDIGMLHLDPLLLDPREAISGEQRRQLYSHPLLSAVLIERHHEFPRELLRGVREHHEFLDGSGYPRHLRGEAITPLGRVLALGELVTATLDNGRAAPEWCLDLQLRVNKHRYDPQLVARVQHQLAPQASLQSGSMELQEDPMALLRSTNACVYAWPIGWAQQLPDPGPRREGMQAVAAQAQQLGRVFATVGATELQLAQLSTQALDDGVRLELSLLAQEALWQLRALARQTRRRWRMGDGTPYPEPLQKWLDQAEALVAEH